MAEGTTRLLADSEPIAATNTVFVVEDDAAVRKSVGWLIQSIGLPVEEFSSGAEYLASIDGHRAGCVLLDVRMPHISGLETLEQIRARLRPCPVILLTGHGEVSLAVRAMRAGAFDFLEKPVNEQILLERVQQAIELDQTNRRRWREQEKAQARLQRLTPASAKCSCSFSRGWPTKRSPGGWN
jgi:FixJ family two-component response regulator